MKSEAEIRSVLERCEEVCSFGISDGPCPVEKNGEKGCCAECSMPSTLVWVLGDTDEGASDNGQMRLIEALNGGQKP